MKHERHIFLTGFMGAGKTTLGRGLASIVNLEFVDLDEYIRERQGLEPRQIFDRMGEKAFREIETAALLTLIESPKQLVIALGGGSICLEKNLQLVKENGLLIYLRLPEVVLVQRLEDHTDDRPLLRGHAGHALKQRIHELLEGRQKYYNQSHLVVNALNLTPHLLYREIAASLETALD
jgi:shikimate kinase